jgi:hypothetical protein
MWQEWTVAVIVGGAVAFLVGRLLLKRRQRRRPAETFVPLSQVKKR